MTQPYWCPNPWEWLDLTIRWVSYDRLGMAFCSLCWATPEAYLYFGDSTLEEGVPLEALPTFDFAAYWNSQRIQEIRRLWLAGVVPPMCSGCPRLAGGELPVIPLADVSEPFHKRLIAERLTETPGPRTINLGYDPSCNLACPSCRNHPVRFNVGDEKYVLLEAFQDRVIRPMMKTARWAFFSGYGDPFGSPLYWDLLQMMDPAEHPELDLVFLTNGLGFTRENYGRIPMRDRIKVVQFSIDAFKPETYAKLRGGSWASLMQNCGFISELRKAGKIDRSEWGFVFQAANWRELPAFLEMARAYSVDKVVVYTLLNHAMGDGYGCHAIHHPEHPDHRAAIAVLDEARMAPGLDVYVELAKESSVTA
jgi:hypothetical protein